MPKHHLHRIQDIDPVLQWKGIDLPMLRRLCYPQLNYQYIDGTFVAVTETSHDYLPPHFFEGQSPNLPQTRRPVANLVFLEMEMDFLEKCMSFNDLRRIKELYSIDYRMQDFVIQLEREGARTILAWKSTGWLHDGSLCVPALHLDSLIYETDSCGIFWMPLSQRLTPSEATMVRA